jgi:hypothetical protein
MLVNSGGNARQLEKKNKKNREFFFCGAPDAPEDQAICLFAGLLANPDMALSLPSTRGDFQGG